MAGTNRCFCVVPCGWRATGSTLTTADEPLSVATGDRASQRPYRHRARRIPSARARCDRADPGPQCVGISCRCDSSRSKSLFDHGGPFSGQEVFETRRRRRRLHVAAQSCLRFASAGGRTYWRPGVAVRDGSRQPCWLFHIGRSSADGAFGLRFAAGEPAHAASTARRAAASSTSSTNEMRASSALMRREHGGRVPGPMRGV